MQENKINVKGIFDKIRTNFFIEITTGDIITPREIKYKYNSIFEDRKINIMAYTCETIIAEKFESIISKNKFFFFRLLDGRSSYQTCFANL